MAPRPVFGFDDPGVRIEADFPGQTLFNGLLRDRLRRCRQEKSFDRPAVVIDGLRRRHVQHGFAVECRNLDEHRAGLLCATAAYRAEDACPLTAAQIGRDPYA